jgi:hypothetical protein
MWWAAAEGLAGLLQDETSHIDHQGEGKGGLDLAGQDIDSRQLPIGVGAHRVEFARSGS